MDGSSIPHSDLYLFNEGNLLRAWKHLGAHLLPDGAGVRFAVWAPHAKSVAVSGDFNDWRTTPLEVQGATGVWVGVDSAAQKGQRYKYELVDARGDRREKADPFAFRMEVRPKTASVIWPLAGHAWGDAAWSPPGPDEPMRIYEVHLGSWKRNRTYRDLARDLVDYVESMGFTHVEFLPVMEHPFDGSWGYQVCGFYAATSRFGTPQDLMYLVDAFHRRGIGVFVDWVPAHFPKDEHGLARFDGTHLYEHADPRRGLHKDWDTLIFNYGRAEVANFLLSNALFWLEEFHFDGLRVDAVTSMLYRDYSRDEGEWVPNAEGGNEDFEAIAFVKRLNDLVHAETTAITIAEESATFPALTTPTADGGVGFDMKWNMGWMHDSLDYMAKDPIYRRYHHDRLTFALYYAFHERYLLPLSHDEVVHLKKSLLSRMPGDEWQRHANLRLLHAWQAGHPGKTLLFMGGELGDPEEWNHDGEVPWRLLEVGKHAGQRLLVGDLNRLVRDYPCLHELDHDWKGFAWLDFSDAERSVISFVRWSREQEQGLLFVFNFTPVVHSTYAVPAPRPGVYREILNTDSACYGGSGVGNMGEVRAAGDQLILTLPPLAAVLFQVPHA